MVIPWEEMRVSALILEGHKSGHSCKAVCIRLGQILTIPSGVEETQCPFSLKSQRRQTAKREEKDMELLDLHLLLRVGKASCTSLTHAHPRTLLT